MLPEAKRVVCVGGAVLDRKYSADKPIVPHTSNPVSGCRSFGGVARNVAENLARLGVGVSMVSSVGEDEAGRAIVDQLRGLAVDVSAVTALRGERTAEYVAVLGPDSDLVVGLADMDICDLITVADIDRAWPQLASAAWVFIDCNLPAEVIRAIVARRQGGRFRLAVNGVSTPKAMRLPEDLTGVDILFVNLDEANALLGADHPTARLAAPALVERGAGAVIITQGSAGAVVADADGVVEVPSTPARPVDVTGAGDALIAGTLYRLIAGEALAEALRAGSVLAALTVESRFTVLPELSPRLLDAAADRVPELT